MINIDVFVQGFSLRRFFVCIMNTRAKEFWMERIEVNSTPPHNISCLCVCTSLNSFYSLFIIYQKITVIYPLRQVQSMVVFTFTVLLIIFQDYNKSLLSMKSVFLLFALVEIWWRYSRCCLDLEIWGNSPQADNYTWETDIWNIG